MRRTARRPSVVIATRIFSPEPAAAAHMLKNVALTFDADGWDVRVLTTKYAGAGERLPPGITVRRFPVLRNRAGYVRGYLSYLSFDLPLAFRLLFARRADLIYVEPPPTTGAVVRVIAALRRTPVLYDAADLWSDAAVTTTRSRLVLRGLRQLERFAMNGARVALVVATGYAERMRAIGIRVPMTVVGFGADTTAFAYTPSPEPVPPLFVYGGSYSEWHGAHIFVEAFPRVLAAAPDARLLFIGHGSARPRLEQLARSLGIEAAVEFRDAIPAADLAQILSRATASLASLEPGVGYDYAFATKIFSSLATGCPVVFSGAGPAGPFIRDASAAVRAGAAVGFSTTEVVPAMTALLLDPITPSDRMRLANWTRTEHSMTAVAQRVVAAARQVVAP